MVYCGKPSKACGECRLRRTKCDYKRPSCSQCKRGRRTCGGYRDPSDIIFRDESEGLSARRQRLKDASNQKPIPIDSTTQTSPTEKAVVLGSSRSSTSPTPIPVLSVNPSFSPEERATCFFFQNYILEEDNLSTGSFEFLPNIFLTNKINEALTNSLTAVGLVGLACFYRDPSLMLTAVYKYNSAMRTLSLQLRDIEDAKSDQTLIAIMLLGLYEVNTCNSRQSIETWTKHMNGAATLMQLRGKQQLRMPLGFHLFKQLRTQLVINCIHRQTPVPSFITEWSQQLDFETLEQAAGTAISLLVIRYANLRASMSSPRDYSDPESIISAAYALECDLASWAKSIPLQYIYQTINLSERVDEVYSDHYHVYPNILVATIWNHYRCARLLTNKIILDQLNLLYETNPTSPFLINHPCYYKSQMLESNATLMHLCEDICASVPYYMGFPYEVGQNSVRQLPKAVHANLLIWPLYTAGATWLVSDLMRNWVSGRLQWIADVMGVRQAATQAASLRGRGKKHLLTWDSN